MKPTLTKILAASGAVLLLAGWGVQAATDRRYCKHCYRRHLCCSLHGRSKDDCVK